MDLLENLNATLRTSRITRAVRLTRKSLRASHASEPQALHAAGRKMSKQGQEIGRSVVE